MWIRSAIGIVLLAVCAQANAVTIWVERTSLMFVGPGGFYGLAELEGVSLVSRSNDTEWKTHFSFGPARFTLPLRLPAAVGMVGGIAGGFVFGFSVWRKSRLEQGKRQKPENSGAT